MHPRTLRQPTVDTGGDGHPDGQEPAWVRAAMVALQDANAVDSFDYAVYRPRHRRAWPIGPWILVLAALATVLVLIALRV